MNTDTKVKLQPGELSYNDIDRICIAACFVKDNKKTTHELARFQFTECLVRIADFKYFRTEMCKDHIEAIETLFDTHVDPWFKYQNELVWGTMNWRANQLFSEEVHLVLYQNMPLLR